MYSPVRSAWYHWIEKSTIGFSRLKIFGTQSSAKKNPTSGMFGLHVLAFFFLRGIVKMRDIKPNMPEVGFFFCRTLCTNYFLA